jgi:hypothetical protein
MATLERPEVVTIKKEVSEDRSDMVSIGKSSIGKASTRTRNTRGLRKIEIKFE